MDKKYMVGDKHTMYICAVKSEKKKMKIKKMITSPKYYVRSHTI